MHLKHQDGHFEKVPYFSLPANELTEVIAPSCYACFDYPNALADLVRTQISPGQPGSRPLAQWRMAQPSLCPASSVQGAAQRSCP